MNENEYLDMMKRFGHIVWACLDCSFRGFGAPTFYHEMKNPTHQLVNEDKCTLLKGKRSD